jgi:hypothetical protein
MHIFLFNPPTNMAFKPFGVLIKHCVQYMEDNSIKLIITENEIYEVQFSPRTFNEHCKYSEEQMLHGICGIEIGPRILLLKSDRPFRIDDLEHYPIYPRDWTSNKPVSAGAFTNSPRDVIDSFVKELKYRKAKNDRIEELERQISLRATPLGRLPFGYHIDEDIQELDFERETKRELLVCRTNYELLQRDNKELLAQIAILRSDTALESKLAEANARCKKLADVARRLRNENTDIIHSAQKQEERSTLELAEIIRKNNGLEDKLAGLLRDNDCLEDNTTPVVLVAEEIPDVSDLKAQIQSLKLQLATEKRISQKYARDLQEKDKQQSVLTAM